MATTLYNQAQNLTFKAPNEGQVFKDTNNTSGNIYKIQNGQIQALNLGQALTGKSIAGGQYGQYGNYGDLINAATSQFKGQGLDYGALPTYNLGDITSGAKDFGITNPSGGWGWGTDISPFLNQTAALGDTSKTVAGDTNAVAKATQSAQTPFNYAQTTALNSPTTPNPLSAYNAGASGNTGQTTALQTNPSSYAATSGATPTTLNPQQQADYYKIQGTSANPLSPAQYLASLQSPGGAGQTQANGSQAQQLETLKQQLLGMQSKLTNSGLAPNQEVPLGFFNQPTNQGTGTSPVAPVPPAPTIPNTTQTSALEQRIASEMVPTSAENSLTDQEIALQNQLAQLNAGQKQANLDLENQPIATGFISGQQASIERQQLLKREENAIQQQTIQARLANLQAKRQSALDVNKFALERSDKAAENAAGQAKTAAETAKLQAETAALGKPKAITPYEQAQLDISSRKADADIGKTELEIKKLEQEVGVAAGTGATAINQLALASTSIKNAIDLSYKSGSDTYWESLKQGVAGATAYSNLVAETNSIRAIALTLATDPSIKKFFGPQMSNADVQFMMAAGTTLNPSLQSPEKLKTELVRLQGIITKLSSVGTSQGSGSGSNPLGI